MVVYKKSDLLNFVCTPLKIKETNVKVKRELAEQALLKNRIKVKMKLPEEMLELLIEEVKKLPIGTVFCLQYLMYIPHQGTASVLGTKFAKIGYTSTLFKSIGGNSTNKSRYKRLGDFHELCADSDIEVLADN